MSLSAEKKQQNSKNDVETLYQLSYEATNRCVQCGYCLPVCPTYKTMGKETASPRGRINLVKLASEGKIDIVDHLSQPIDLCLGCRACEVACPVGVPYGLILDSAKQVIAKAQKVDKKPSMKKSVKNIILKHLFPHPNRLRGIGNLIWIYQKSGVYKAVRKTKILNKLSEPLAQLEKVLPILESPSKRYHPGSIIPAKGDRKGTIAFFLGCISDAVLHRTNRLSIELLSLAGLDVIIPDKQKCCGALHTHQGMDEQAKALAKDNIAAFEQSEAEFYVNNAGGCGAMLSEYDKLLKDEELWVERAKQFVRKSKDISEILVQYGPLPFIKSWNGIITYQDSCHLRNVQGVYKEPRKLLQSIPGATYIEMEGSDQCCASGGIYNILHFNESMKILDKKMDKVKNTKATTIITANPGCLLQLRAGVERHGASQEIDTLHLIDILAEACGIE